MTWLNDWLTDWLMTWLNDWLTDWLMTWLNDWLTDWLTDWWPDWLTDWFMNWLIEQLADYWTCRSQSNVAAVNAVDSTSGFRGLASNVNTKSSAVGEPSAQVEYLILISLSFFLWLKYLNRLLSELFGFLFFTCFWITFLSDYNQTASRGIMIFRCDFTWSIEGIRFSVASNVFVIYLSPLYLLMNVFDLSSGVWPSFWSSLSLHACTHCNFLCFINFSTSLETSGI